MGIGWKEQFRCGVLWMVVGQGHYRKIMDVTSIPVFKDDKLDSIMFRNIHTEYNRDT